MACGMGLIKYLLFIFNFIFVLCGLAVLAVGIVVHLKIVGVNEVIADNVTFPSVTLIVVGSIIFIIAFFGCCGAIRESHCMIITFACLLLALLIIQVAVAVYAFVTPKNLDNDKNSIKEAYTSIFNNYWDQKADRELVDVIQSTLHCCGVDSASDYSLRSGSHFNGTIPGSCCGKPEGSLCDRGEAYQEGCVKEIKNFFKYAATMMGGVALASVFVELVGIIFALCLANSIKNADRRGYRV